MSSREFFDYNGKPVYLHDAMRVQTSHKVSFLLWEEEHVIFTTESEDFAFEWSVSAADRRYSYVPQISDKNHLTLAMNPA